MQYGKCHMVAAVIIAHADIDADAATQRRTAPRAEFMRANPCPVSGLPHGPCPGWIVDHIIPLCAGGRDHPRNMQWQTVNASRLKDKEERERCRLLRKGHAGAILPPSSNQ